MHFLDRMSGDDLQSLHQCLKSLDTVTASATEEEENVLFIWIQLEVEFNNGCQPINPAA